MQNAAAWEVSGKAREVFDSTVHSRTSKLSVVPGRKRCSCEGVFMNSWRGI